MPEGRRGKSKISAPNGEMNIKNLAIKCLNEIGALFVKTVLKSKVSLLIQFDIYILFK